MTTLALPASDLVAASPSLLTTTEGATADPLAPTDGAQHLVDPRGTADFAALLQSFHAEPSPAATEALAPEANQTSVESPPALDAPPVASAVDALLFLSSVHPQLGVRVSTPAASVAQTPPIVTSHPFVGRHGATAELVSLQAVAAEPALAASAAATGQASFAPNAPGRAEAVNVQAESETETAVRVQVGVQKQDPPLSERAQASLASAPPFAAAAAAELPAKAAANLPTVGLGVSTLAAEPPAAIPPAPQGTTAPPAASIVDIERPLHDPAWRAEAATRIASLVTRGVEHAQLRVTPPELGPVEVRIEVRGGEATLAIVATHAPTRDALEQALPLLRDLLAQQGLSLGQANVHDGRPQHPRDQSAAPRSFDAEAGTQTGGTATADAPRTLAMHRLVDVFA